MALDSGWVGGEGEILGVFQGYSRGVGEGDDPRPGPVRPVRPGTPWDPLGPLGTPPGWGLGPLGPLWPL
eukprot:6133615-Prymnesium_polylepis.1